MESKINIAVDGFYLHNDTEILILHCDLTHFRDVDLLNGNRKP
jgi:hypothetical protein